MIARALVIAAVFLLPVVSLASTFDYEPAGQFVTSPVTITISTTLLEQQAFNNLDIVSNPYSCLRVNESTGNFVFESDFVLWDIPNEEINNGVYVVNIPDGMHITEIQLNSLDNDVGGCPSSGVAGETFYVDFYTPLEPTVYERTPNDYLIPYGTPVVLNYNFNSSNAHSNLQDCLNSNGTCYATFSATGVEGNGMGEYYGSCMPVTIGNNYLTDTFSDIPIGGIEGLEIYFSETCDLVTTVASVSLENPGGGWLLRIEPVPTITNIWGSNDGFWGSTTPGVIIDDMAASVQETGDNIYPLLVFVGIPMGLAIAGYLVYQIKLTLTPVDQTEAITNRRRYGTKRKKE